MLLCDELLEPGDGEDRPVRVSAEDALDFRPHEQQLVELDELVRIQGLLSLDQLRADIADLISNHCQRLQSARPKIYNTDVYLEKFLRFRLLGDDAQVFEQPAALVKVQSSAAVLVSLGELHLQPPAQKIMTG